MTDHDIIINLHNDLYFTIQQMKQFIQVLEAADRRDYVTAEDIRTMQKNLINIIVGYNDTMQALVKADDSIE